MVTLFRLLLRGNDKKEPIWNYGGANFHAYGPHEGPSINYVKREGEKKKYIYICLRKWGRGAKNWAWALRKVTQKSVGSDYMETFWEFSPTSVQKSTKSSNLIRLKSTRQRDVIFKGERGSDLRDSCLTRGRGGIKILISAWRNLWQACESERKNCVLCRVQSVRKFHTHHQFISGVFF